MIGDRAVVAVAAAVTASLLGLWLFQTTPQFRVPRAAAAPVVGPPPALLPPPSSAPPPPPPPPPPRSPAPAATGQVSPAPPPPHDRNGLPPLGGAAVNGTVFATSGNWAFRDFLQNVVVTLREAVPAAVPVVAMLDQKGAQWCRGGLHSALCALFRCPCPYQHTANLSADGYTQCLLGIYICKLRIKLAILEAGYDVFFIDADAAARRNVLAVVMPMAPVAAVGACEHCLGTCALDKRVAALTDHPQKGPVPLAGYWQLNIGFIWLNHTDPVPAAALRESITAIVQHRLDFKSVDQTVFNRRLIAHRANTRCLSDGEGGLNVRGRSSRPKSWPGSWGVHAARLVSKDSFYKKALLWHNGLWRGNTTEEFVRLAALWRAKPSAVKRQLQQQGRL
eukprot:TRINITY_DN6413_c0_g1_i1.p1 TRINITY_DN6413_c0_g1~~TRINITY_DN6413_c0_g1_i1.p1  ORF type:complete len:410 (+),score=140.90 TRINITY_DN6413_c0_g1_i1:52-1230(+)